ncbi:p6 [Beet yellow stunt virus]|uniref:p6 n=1 Tax=Beet yellow stunt virus TaxID=35290 RepID=Q89655_9CLOS|nr:p6 [Beet yellow stunt virus]AAC55661.1 p6 [Beet yellow stunt virus]
MDCILRAFLPFGFALVICFFIAVAAYFFAFFVKNTHSQDTDVDIRQEDLAG